MLARLLGSREFMAGGWESKTKGTARRPFIHSIYSGEEGRGLVFGLWLGCVFGGFLLGQLRTNWSLRCVCLLSALNLFSMVFSVA